MSFETLDHRVVLDAAGLDVPTQELVSEITISEVSQQASINYPFSPNNTICPITFTTDELDGEKVNLSNTNLESSSLVDSRLTNTDRAFADLSWLSLANTDTTDQDIASSNSTAKDKFATILSEFSDQ